MVKSKRNRNSAPWWSEDCTEAVRNRKQALKTFKKVPTWDNWEIYRKTKNICKKILLKAKRKGWRGFWSSFDSKTPITELWNLIKMFKRRNS